MFEIFEYPLTQNASPNPIPLLSCTGQSLKTWAQSSTYNVKLWADTCYGNMNTTIHVRELIFSAKNMTQQHKQYNSNYDNSTQVHRPVLEIIKIYISHEYSYILSICWDMLYLIIRLNEDCWLHSFNCIKTHTVIPNTDVDTVESDSKLFGTIDRDLPASDDTFTSWKMAENSLLTPW